MEKRNTLYRKIWNKYTILITYQKLQLENIYFW